MKEYQYLIGKVIVAMAIIVAAIIIAQAIGGAGESIRSGLLQLGDVNCKTKFHSQILKLEINLSKKHWRLILPKKDYNSYHWFTTCCSNQNRRT